MIHILLSTDKNYIMPSAVMMKSVSVNNAYEDITFHILIDESVNEEQKKQLKHVLSNRQHLIAFHLIEGNIFAGFPQLGKVKKYITQATYYRLIIADLLPQDIHRVIYLDGDIIVRKSLKELWNMNLDGIAVGTVTDMAEDKHDYKRLGYDKKYGYFNAGVLLINLDYWRENNMKSVFFNLIANEPQRIVLHDQDVLNITLYNKKKDLSFIYNAQSGFFHHQEHTELGKKYNEYWPQLKQAIIDPAIIHYTDKIKPWHIEDSHPYGYEFIKYYKQTEWRFEKLKPCGASKIRHIGGKVLRVLHLLAPVNLKAERYYSLEEINKTKNS